MRSQTHIFLIFIALLFMVLLPPVSAYSSEATALYTQGVALTTSKNYTEAIQVFDQAITREPGYFEAWNGKADALNRAQRYNDALVASDQALALNPKDARIWINRGYILYNLGRYDDELKAYEQAIHIDPSNAEAWFNKGYALGGMGHWNDALTAFDTVESLDPAYPNLKANQQIARKNLDASTPFYIKNAPMIGGIAVVIILVIAWLYAVRKKY